MSKATDRGKAGFIPLEGGRDARELLAKLDAAGQKAAAIGYDPKRKLVILQWFDGSYVGYTPATARAFAEGIIKMAEKAERGDPV